MPNEVSLTLLDAMRFRVRTGSGHEMTIDASPDVGGVNAGPRPMELQLAALAGCASMDVISILRKMRQDVTAYACHAAGETASEHPKRYTRIVVTHRLRGRAIAEANVRRALHLSMSRYCPVFAMLSPGVPISVRYEIEDEAGGVAVPGEVGLGEPGAA